MCLHCVAIAEAFNSGIFTGSYLLCPITTAGKVSKYLCKVRFFFIVSVFPSLSLSLYKPEKRTREFHLRSDVISSYLFMYASPIVGGYSWSETSCTSLVFSQRICASVINNCCQQEISLVFASDSYHAYFFKRRKHAVKISRKMWFLTFREMEEHLFTGQENGGNIGCTAVWHIKLKPNSFQLLIVHIIIVVKSTTTTSEKVKCGTLAYRTLDFGLDKTLV